MSSDKPFFFRKPSDLDALKKWLSDRTFNCGGYTTDDKKGNPMVGLGYDSDPDNDWKLPDKRGLIVVIHKASLADVEAAVNAACKASP